MWWLLTTLLACTGDTPETESDTLESEPWSWTEDSGDIVELWTAAEVGEAIEGELEGGLPTPTDLWRATDVVVGVAEAECGYSERGFKALLSCTTESGWYLYGFVNRASYDIDKDGVSGNVYTLVSDFIVLDAEGRTFDGGGETAWTVAEQESGVTQLSMSMEGTWTVEAAEQWFGDGAGVRLENTVSSLLTLEGSASDEGTQLVLDGGITIGGQAPVVFESFEWGLTCPDAPSGGMRTRDPTGRWYDLILSAETCDGCGQVMYGDEALGEVCIDVGEDLAETVRSLRFEVDADDEDTGA